MRRILFMFLVLTVSAPATAGRTTDPWTGYWTFDVCHEDRKSDHDKDSFCRQGRDRIQVKRDGAGRYDIVRCPADPWGESQVKVGPDPGRLGFRTRDGLEFKLVLDEDRKHFKGSFRSRDGHSGRAWGQRVTSCR